MRGRSHRSQSKGAYYNPIRFVSGCKWYAGRFIFEVDDHVQINKAESVILGNIVIILC